MLFYRRPEDHIFEMYPVTDERIEYLIDHNIGKEGSHERNVFESDGGHIKNGGQYDRWEMYHKYSSYRQCTTRKEDFILYLKSFFGLIKL